MTIKTAPINISSPAVENRPIPDFSESLPKDLLMKNAAIIAKTHRISRTVKIPIINGAMLSKEMLVGSGFRPERAAQSPFQSGKIVCRKSVNEVRTVTTTTETEITVPTIIVINPYNALLKMVPSL